MLTSILEILARKESLSLAQLATEVGCSIRDVEGFLNQLEHMGYIQRELLGQTCSLSCDLDKGCNHCEGCGFKPMDTFTFWVLTKRGEQVVSSKLK